jgi:hypothetical protein
MGLDANVQNADNAIQAFPKRLTFGRVSPKAIVGLFIAMG